MAKIQQVERPRIPQDLESFLQEQGDTWFADRWAGREVEEGGIIEGVALRSWAQPPEIGGYRACPMSDGIRYEHPDGWTAFVDRGQRIEVVPGRDDEALLAALRLAADKFGQFQIKGNDAFRKRARKVAIESGLGEHIIEEVPRIRAKGPVLITQTEDAAANEHIRDNPAEVDESNHRSGATGSGDRLANGAQQGTSDDISAKSSNWETPDHRADPARVAHIESLIADLKKEQHLPLRWSVSRDWQGGTTRTLQIDTDLPDKLDPRASLFSMVGFFDEDPAIQNYFAENHRQMLEAAEALLRLQAGQGRERVLNGDFDDIGQGESGLSRSLFLMRESKEVADLLDRLTHAWNHEDERCERLAKSRSQSSSNTDMEVRHMIRAKGPRAEEPAPPGYEPGGKGAAR